MALWNQTLKFSSIVNCGVDIQFPLYSQQLINHHAHVQFHDFPVALPHHYIIASDGSTTTDNTLSAHSSWPSWSCTSASNVTLVACQ